MNKLRNISRWIIGLSSLTIIVAFFIPIWRIDLFAPQYPEGLTMKIWLSKLSGDVDIINGLNHYIGMAKIKESMFPEFNYMTYAVAAYILIALYIAFSGNRRLLNIYLGMSVILTGLVIFDFYKWGYHYGHELNPNAPIKVPGMAYQPPVIGHKKMLNFDAYSMPDIGGWIFIGFGAIVTGVAFLEWRARRKRAITVMPAVVLSLMTLLISCTGGFKQISYGKDACDNCKMTIIDKKFAVEIISVKGKAYKFDDLICTKQFVENKKIDAKEIGDIFVNYYNKPGEFIKFKESYLVSNEWLKTPMSGNMAAFASQEEAMRFIETHGGDSLASNSIIRTE